MKKIKRNTQDVLDYVWDFGNEGTWLGTDTISAATVTGIGCTVDSYTNTTTTVTAWISGGTGVPSATCHITTAGGRQKIRTIIFDMTNG